MITVQQLDKLVLLTKAQLFVQPINDTLVKYDITTPARMRHFLAQVLHESCNLVYTKEIASGQAYEGRKDLGNIHPGDGVRYKGRGLIQVTGRDNYENISGDLGIDFITHPELLETPQYAALSAGWFWGKEGLNKYADLPDTWLGAYGRHQNCSPIEVITRNINGGLNGFQERKQNYSLLKTII